MRVYYDLPVGTVAIEPVSRDRQDRVLAAANLAIIAEAYGNEFETKGINGVGQLPAGSVRNHFSPDDPLAVEANRRRIRESSQHGSQYWRAMLDDEQVGLGKLTPSYAHGSRGKVFGEKPNAYINDVIVAPKHQSRHIGSALLHAMLLTSPTFDRTAKVVFDMFRNPPIEDKVRSLGFQLVGAVTLPSIEIAGTKLPQWRYETDAEHGISTTLSGLEKQAPELEDYRIA